jgi:hypothetical protein
VEIIFIYYRFVDGSLIVHTYKLIVHLKYDRLINNSHKINNHNEKIFAINPAVISNRICPLLPGYTALNPEQTICIRRYGGKCIYSNIRS